MTASPRCCKPMTRYEAANGPMPEQPECARPENHNGRCRSAAALARMRAADLARLAAAVQPCACDCGEDALWGHRYRRGHNPRDTQGNWIAVAPPVETELAERAA